MVKHPKLHEVLSREFPSVLCVDEKNVRAFVDYLKASEENLLKELRGGFAILPVRKGRETGYFIYTKPTA